MIAPQSTYRPPPSSRQPIGDAAFKKVAQHLHDETGIVLSYAKKSLAVSRLSRRLRVLGLQDFDAYCDVLSGSSGGKELQEMVLLLTTNVTRFFREPHHFESLRSQIMPGLIVKARSGGRVRIWSAGCSTGEEPYSIAMTVLDTFPDANAYDLRVLATDIDSNVVRTGQAGQYHVTDEELAEHPILRKYSSQGPQPDNDFSILPDVKSLVQFGQLNLLVPWPMHGKFDVIFCRNVVIYFSTETQHRLWPRFADLLTEGGQLMIGHSERVSGLGAELLRSVGVTQYELSAQEARR